MIAWVTATDLGSIRIDAEFYKHEFVDHYHMIDACAAKRPESVRRLGSLAKLRTGPFGSKLPSALFRSRGIPVFRVENVEAWFPNRRGLAHLDLEDHRELLASEILPGDLMMAKAGRVGDTCIFAREFGDRGNITEHVIAITPDEETDPYYLTVALNSPFVKKQAERFGLGTLINYLGVDVTRQFRLPWAKEDIQRAIGNKLRKAERLRELADDGHASFVNWLNTVTKVEKLESGELAFLDHIPANTCSDKAWITDIDLADRVDPWPHHVVPRTIKAHLRRWSGIRSFTDLFDVATDTRPRLTPPPAPLGFHLSILDIDAGGRIDWENASQTRYDGSGIEVHEGDVLYPTLNPQETRVGYIPSGTSGTIAASPEFSILRLRDEFADYPYLASAVLRSNWVRVQASFLTRSSSLSRRRLAEDDLAKILVPWNEDGASELEKKVALASDAYIQAGVLIDQAKADVEALISNTLNLDALHAESAAIESWLAANHSPVASKK